MFLLDTNVISELRKVRLGKADRNVAQWSERVAAADLYVSAITIAELELGILLLARRDQQQGALLHHWLHQQVLPGFAGRILPVDQIIALKSAQLHVPNPRQNADGLIAATALIHGMPVVTRNVVDFVGTGVVTINPWLAI
jgi:predicted nucleic acid-binding protein